MTDIDKLQLAKEAFATLKEQSKHTGKSISVSAIAKESGVDRKYFYGKINTPNEELKKRWKNLGDTIRDYKKEQRSNPSLKSTEYSESIKEIKEAVENSVRENYSLIEQLKLEQKKVATLLQQRDAALNQAVDLKSRVSALEIKSSEKTLESRGTVSAFRSKPTIISPDLVIKSELDRKKAWHKALTELRQALSDNFDKELLITIGVPGTGKTYWANNYRSRPGKRTIIFDATNITRVDRYDLVEISKASPRTSLVAVCLMTDLDLAIARNSTRTAEKLVPESKIREMADRMELPKVGDPDDTFDEILIVRV